MLTAEKYIVRVANDARIPDIDIFTDSTQGLAISVEGIARPHERGSVARRAREIIQKTLCLFTLDTPKEVVRNTLALLKRELAEHFGNESKKQGIESGAIGAHTAVVKFAWDEENGGVVALSDTCGGFKNYGFRGGKLALFNGEAPVRQGDIIMQCSPSINTHLDWEVMQEILNFRNRHNLSLEQIRQLLIESAYNNLDKFRHTPLYDPRDMSVVLLEFDPVRAEREREEKKEFEKIKGSALKQNQFDFGDLLLPEGATEDEALLALQNVRNRLRGFGYESKIKPHRYAELPKDGNLQRVVKRAHDILEAEELRQYLKKK